MMRYLTNNPFRNFLLASCCVLMLVVATEWLIPYRSNGAAFANTRSVDVQVSTNNDSAYVHPHIDDFSEILARPIFFQARELPPEAEAAAVAPRAPLRLKLEGIASAADSRVAVLRDQGNNQLVQLSAGMSHNDWLLERMTSTTASFRRGDDVAELTLEP